MDDVSAGTTSPIHATYTSTEAIVSAGSVVRRLFGLTGRGGVVARKKPRTAAGKKAKVEQVMTEWKGGTLHSGSKKGPVVRNQRQAVAIALSQSGQSRRPQKPKSKR